MTTTRKFFSILGSVIIHGHTISTIQWIGVIFVFAGLSAEVYEKYEKRFHKKPTTEKPLEKIEEEREQNGHHRESQSQKRSVKAN